METWSAHHLFKKATVQLNDRVALDLSRYAQCLRNQGLPVIFTLGHLAKITGIDYTFLHATVNREREAANYRMFAIRKRSGGKRFIHAVSNTLSSVHEFLNREVLSKVEPHPASYAYHRNGGIRACAQRHCGARWLLHFDLKDFFFTIHEAKVCQIFREMGYRELLSFELARLCTTTRLPRHLSHLTKPSDSCFKLNKLPYRRYHSIGVLPQGASTSPMLSNLAARHLDQALYLFAKELGLVYTRYADDLTFSAYDLPRGWSIGKFKFYVEKTIRKYGFRTNPSKFSVCGPGSRKIVLGLLVDGDRPRLSKWTRHRIDRLLYSVNKFGWEKVAEFYKFDSLYGFFNHLRGLIAYAKDADPMHGDQYRTRFEELIERFPVEL